MATNTNRGSALRSLPVLLALLIAFITAPAAVPAAERLTGGTAASVSSSIVGSLDAPVATSAESTAMPAAEAALRSPVADTARVLATQSTAGTASSRAPPFADA
jgi:hypothetical protein